MLTKFQFHKGTIKTLVSDTCVPIDNINFNSIKVRLKHLIFCCTLFNIKYFNSIKVRLKLVIAIKVAIYALGYFNSIKVRLKRPAYSGSQHTPRFQFHKGTIKTERSLSWVATIPISIP